MTNDPRILIDAFKAILIRQMGPLGEKPLVELTSWYCALSEITDEIYEQSIVATADESAGINRKALSSLRKNIRDKQ